MLLSGADISPWTGRFYSLLDPTYAKEHIPIIASVSEHQPTTWYTPFLSLSLFSSLSLFIHFLSFLEI
jgi:dolichyl-diphosphooligosaccharide--protein glycosyltransferase